MALTDTNLALKQVLGVEATDSNKRIIEEFATDTLTLFPIALYASTPDSNPAQAIIDGDVEQRTLFALTQDLTVPNAE